MESRRVAVAVRYGRINPSAVGIADLKGFGPRTTSASPPDAANPDTLLEARYGPIQGGKIATPSSCMPGNGIVLTSAPLGYAYSSI